MIIKCHKKSKKKRIYEFANFSDKDNVETVYELWKAGKVHKNSNNDRKFNLENYNKKNKN